MLNILQQRSSTGVVYQQRIEEMLNQATPLIEWPPLDDASHHAINGNRHIEEASSSLASMQSHTNDSTSERESGAMRRNDNVNEKKSSKKHYRRQVGDEQARFK